MIARIYLLLFFLSASFFHIGCRNNSSKYSVISIVAENAYNQVLYLDDIPAENGSAKHIDSIFIKDRVQNVSFIIPDGEEGLFRVYTKDHRVDIVTINDTSGIVLNLDYLNNGNFNFSKSDANISLHRFLNQVKEKATQARLLSTQGPLLSKQADSIFLSIQYDYRNYVDTVRSPAAALYVYNNIDFGSDRPALKGFITKLANRFKEHKRIQDLFRRTEDFLRIFEEEIEIGAKIPDLLLPSNTGELISLSNFKGRYLLVDFWASWDPASTKQEAYNNKASQKFANRNFSIVSISLDPEKESWKQYLAKSGFKWTQLIDDQVWMGSAVKSFKFDSIPFNFLVSPEGKVIGKAMFGDSLLIKLDKLIQ